MCKVFRHSTVKKSDTPTLPESLPLYIYLKTASPDKLPSLPSRLSIVLPEEHINYISNIIIKRSK
jgi:hypothetical protein